MNITQRIIFHSPLVPRNPTLLGHLRSIHILNPTVRQWFFGLGVITKITLPPKEPGVLPVAQTSTEHCFFFKVPSSYHQEATASVAGTFQECEN